MTRLDTAIAIVRERVEEYQRDINVLRDNITDIKARLADFENRLEKLIDKRDTLLIGLKIWMEDHSDIGSDRDNQEPGGDAEEVRRGSSSLQAGGSEGGPTRRTIPPKHGRSS